MNTRVRRRATASPVAVIDIGTNSVKLLVARVQSGRVHPLHFDRATTRLGASLVRTHRIDNAAELRTLRALKRFTADARRLGAGDVIAVGTHAFRAAHNGREVAKRLERATGLRVSILSGSEEALAAFRSARAHLRRRLPVTVMLDVGGGSAELVVARADRVLRARSLPLGALHLTGLHLTTDPIDAGEFTALVRDATTRLARAWSPFADTPAANMALVVSGGASTTALAMAHHARGSSGPTLTRADLEQILDACLSRTIAQRMRLPGLPADRAEIMPAGVAVVLALLRVCGKRSLTVNDGGLREGVLLAYFT